mgnify:CR=1 FL=1
MSAEFKSPERIKTAIYKAGMVYRTNYQDAGGGSILRKGQRSEIIVDDKTMVLSERWT